MDMDAKKAIVRRIRDNLKHNEVFCTKIVKGPKGESVLVGLTASVDGLSPEEAEIATLVLGQEVDQLAYDRAAAGSVITSGDHAIRSKKTKANYSMLINEALDRIAKKTLRLTGTDE